MFSAKKICYADKHGPNCAINITLTSRKMPYNETKTFPKEILVLDFNFN